MRSTIVASIALGIGLAVACPAVPLDAQEAPPAPASVRALLASARVPTDGLPDVELAEAPLDFAIESSAALTTFVYRVATPGGPPRLAILVRDHAAGSWRTASFDNAPLTRGIVQEAMHVGDWLVVDTARDGLAGDLLVFDRTLAVHDRIDGSLVGVIPGDGVLFRENVGGAGPARPLAVSLYLPGRQSRERIYPPDAPPGPTRQHHVERVRRAYANWGLQRCLAASHPCNAEQFDAFVVSGVRADARGRRFGWVTRFGPAEADRTAPVTFHAFVLVSCDRPEGAAGATCRERPFGQYDGPEGPNTLAALAASLTRRGERP